MLKVLLCYVCVWVGSQKTNFEVALYLRGYPNKLSLNGEAKYPHDTLLTSTCDNYTHLFYLLLPQIYIVGPCTPLLLIKGATQVGWVQSIVNPRINYIYPKSNPNPVVTQTTKSKFDPYLFFQTLFENRLGLNWLN